MPIETFNISFESTRNKQQYGTNITSTEVNKKDVAVKKNVTTFSVFDI